MFYADGSSTKIINNKVIDDSSWNISSNDNKNYDVNLKLNNQRYLIKGLQNDHLNNLLTFPQDNFDIKSILKEYHPVNESKNMKRHLKTLKKRKKNKYSRRIR